jgi:hypothetical protein
MLITKVFIQMQMDESVATSKRIPLRSIHMLEVHLRCREQQRLFWSLPISVRDSHPQACFYSEQAAFTYLRLLKFISGKIKSQLVHQQKEVYLSLFYLIFSESSRIRFHLICYYLPFYYIDFILQYF